jgi:uncharacterized protein (DUF2249 family)
MQSRGRGDSGGDRIRHSRFDSKAPEAARAFVMRQLQALPRGCVLEIEFRFDPSDLLDDLTERSAHARVRKIARRRWVLLLQPPGERELMDLCDLEAPLPMERILEAAARLRPGEALIALTPCFPRPLLAQLDRRGLDWEAAEAAGASGIVWVGRPS